MEEKEQKATNDRKRDGLGQELMGEGKGADFDTSREEFGKQMGQQGRRRRGG